MTETDPPPPHDDDPDRAERMRGYRRRYWERFRETRRRVYGTLSAEEYAAFEKRAEEAGRAVWEQIQAEAEAYARNAYLPHRDIEERVSELIVQLRRIGNNVNQIAHVLNAGGDYRYGDLSRSLDELERLIRRFVQRPWREPPATDGEPPSS